MEESNENKKGKKKWLLLLIALAILILGGVLAYAADKVYLDSKGNKLGSTSNGWEAHSNNCGARISIVDKNRSTIAGPRDFYSSSDLGDMVEYVMGSANKFDTSGSKFLEVGEDIIYKPVTLKGLPQTCGSGVDKEVIVEFLKESKNVKNILDALMFDGKGSDAEIDEEYDKLVSSGDKYLIIEPIAIFTCDPDESDDDYTVYNLACTATEVADYDSNIQ